MRARYQLNAFYLCGCLLAAIAVGVMLQSWLAFGAALAVIVAIKVQDGGIRLTQQPRIDQGGRMQRTRQRCRKAD